MPNFRFYLLDGNGLISSRRDIECDDDVAACRTAKEIDHPYTVEIWQGARRIGLVTTQAAILSFKPKT